MGIDPQSGKPVSVKIGRFGPVAQKGESGSEEKPTFANLKAGQSIETITLDEALELFKLPRELGEFEGVMLKANSGRFGPYVQMNKLYVSIPKDEDPMTISLERAIELVQMKREADAKSLLKTFDEEPGLEVKMGRWGPYIAYKRRITKFRPRRLKMRLTFRSKIANASWRRTAKSLYANAKPLRKRRKTAALQQTAG